MIVVSMTMNMIIFSRRQIVQNLHMVMVYQTFCGLMPLLATPGAGGQIRGGHSHIKLTVPVVELAGQAVRSTLAILEAVPIETTEEVCIYKQ